MPFFNRLYHHTRNLLTVGKSVNEAKMLAAKLLIDRNAQRESVETLADVEFKVFSQFGEDGIIQYLIRRAGVGPRERSFVEFGAETYNEANTRFLAVNDNWRGLLIDGSRRNIETIRNSPTFWMYDLTAVAAFVTAENIDELIRQAGYEGSIGLLSIDIDGNDYWVWRAIRTIDPVVVVAEYNSVFGPTRAVTIPYDAAFVRRKAHQSDLYYGCSLKALARLASEKGYALVGSNSAGNNAFFVKKERLNGLPAQSTEQAYVESRYRESVDRTGRFSFLSGAARLREIQDMPLLDLETGLTIRARELLG